MKLRLCFVAAVCLAQQVLGVPVTRDLEDDNAHAQYDVGKFSSETTIFKMRTNSLFLEMDYTIKIINQQIISLMETIAVDPTKIDTVKNEMTKRGEMILDSLQRIMDQSQMLIDLLTDINSDIVNNPAKLDIDLSIMNSAINNLNLAYEVGHENIILYIDLVKMRIDIAIAGREEPEAEQIRALLTEAETIMTSEQSIITAAKEFVDSWGEQARSALQAVIDASSQ